MILSCDDEKTKNHIQQKIQSKESKTLKNEPLVTTENADKGFVVLRNAYQQKDMLTLYNQDQSIWKSFQLLDTFDDEDIAPSIMKPDYTLLVFKYLGKENGFYKVLVNEEKNTVKYIKETDSHFKYQTVPEHLLTLFSVGFNEKENPLRTEPNDKAQTHPTNEDSFYYPIKTNGQWLMVKDDDEKKFWIKWCDEKGHLILELYYLA